jgi:glyoxylase-like metal-dependent hydrolase (beta-lactamase superfamily II)
VNAFLVEHPAGLVLFDAGQTARAARPGYHPAWHPFLRLARFELTADDEIAPQLTRAGFDPADVRWIVLSHLHTDHVGGLAAFGNASVFASRAEWEHGAGVRGRLRGYLPQHWPLAGEPTLLDFSGPAVGPFRASSDLLEDGTLVAVPTTGHSPGHLALVVRGDGRGWLLGGDLAPASALLSAEVAAFCKREGLAVLLAHEEVR